MKIETKWQLWCYYETENKWKMEGFFDSHILARVHLEELRKDVHTPSMPDFEYVRVEVSVP